MYASIYYCIQLYLSIYLGTEKLKSPSEFDFRLNLSDFYKHYFAMYLKCKILLMELFYIFFLSLIQI
jgi:hypothetical protein